ncbi:glycyl-radical enzyme activating protein [Listeria ivanovii]|uniref:glycyl-radical enzyme activating protein n=2 Tax=Listeria ivanovii TaxID=1638 RepID=UPI001C64B234|nr:glycyl-radical enzyme activating protein [Listeria ivanovii]MCJ1718282.1 glycyl-radical enzyme activating protein [Listeria ivanovii]MCJ1723470.1 glycyl-radical enzyme activating protein [Listeria ivanovii]MCJ1736187.1 glycyl-radical enzyme activating protein [Listeria ivanovii]
MIKIVDTKGCVFNIQRFSIHDGPGIRTTIFFKGCPLQCTWCSNPESQKRLPEWMWDNIKKKNILTGDYLTVDEIMSEVLKDIDYYAESGGGVTVTGGEVLAQLPFVIKFLKKCKENGIHTACETSAYSSKEKFLLLLENVDLLIMDIKHYNSEKHRDKTGVKLEPIIENLKLASLSDKDMLLRIPIIPGYNDSLADSEQFALLLSSLNIQAVELLPFHQFGKSKYKFLGRKYEFTTTPQLSTTDLLLHKKNIYFTWNPLRNRLKKDGKAISTFPSSLFRNHYIFIILLISRKIIHKYFVKLV